MDAAYLMAAHPEPFTVLGQRLKPFCLGHEILFQRFRNKFSIESKAAPGIEDMLTGVFICSKPYTWEASMDGFEIPTRAKWLGKSYIKNAFGLFAQYIAAHSDIPEFYNIGDNDPEPTGTPTVQVVKVSLMAHLGLSELDALNTPLSLAFWNHLSWAESQGSIQIIDDEERKKIAKAKAAEAVLDEMAKKMWPNGYNVRGSHGS